MKTLNGKYKYRSFCPKAGAPGTDTAEIAAPWTPPGELTVTTDAAGAIAGKLAFAPGRELTVTGRITAAAERLPEGIRLTGEGLGAVYEIRGYFLDGTDHLVGTVVAVKRDVAGQPEGTQGPFMLFPV